MFKFSRLGRIITITVLVFVGAYAFLAYASHSWGTYHWARTLNPFNLKLGDNVTSLWDGHLATASGDWSASTVLDTSIVAGGAKRNCGPIKGRVEVCNKTYGNNGWLGVASIWVSGSHIVQGTVRLNDTYFNTARFNTPAWRQFVMCQEAGHTFGLDHQDEIFNNPNIGTCMDYTNDPDGALYQQLSNEHPDTHDYSQLETIYTHLDALTTIFNRKSHASARENGEIDTSNAKEWGKVVRKSHDGRSSLHERDLDKGHKLFTFVIWAD